ATREVAELQLQIVETENRRSQFVDHAVDSESALREARGRYEETSKQLGVSENDLRGARQLLEQAPEQLHRLELARREHSISIEHLLEQIRERHRADLLQELSHHHNKPAPDQATESRIEELRRLLERMGEVNLMAAQEFEEKSSRFEFLSTQRSDLEGALGQLE